jgi:hypothetical protein
MNEDELRAAFEAQVSPTAAWGFQRSHKGTYMNPAIARDWKWFQLGAAAALTPKARPSRQVSEDRAALQAKARRDFS